MALKLYGTFVSQPCRAVAWVLKYKAVPFELVSVNPIKRETQKPEFLKLNPGGMVPVLQDEEFVLTEGNAILAYLANKNNWADLYPTEPKARAKVDEYLHWHHENTRLSTMHVMFPHIRQHLGKASEEDLKRVVDTHKLAGRFVGLLDQSLVAPFIAQSEHPTLADFACYVELVQLEMTGVFDFAPYENATAWLKRMKNVPFHDEIHQPLTEFLHRYDAYPIPRSA